MTQEQIRFQDGAAYERYMGVWSQAAGEAFLAWLAPAPGLRWLDVGCGNGAFTEMLAQRCAPASLAGLDPSEAQLAFARTRPALASARFETGDAMALPYADAAFDAAVMPLVLFFVPRPAQGVAEMARVVAPGGIVSAYVWDLPGGGFPYAALAEEMKSMGIDVPKPPSPEVSRLEALTDVWTGAGLEDVSTRGIEVKRSFADFGEYWNIVQGGPSVAGKLKAMPPDDLARLQAAMRARLTPDSGGRIVLSARANAIRGRVR
jgi:SAM-dependent methyltransferase